MSAQAIRAILDRCAADKKFARTVKQLWSDYCPGQPGTLEEKVTALVINGGYTVAQLEQRMNGYAR